MTDIARYKAACRQLGTEDPKIVRQALQWSWPRLQRVLEFICKTSLKE